MAIHSAAEVRGARAGNHPTIQSALDAVPDGGVICVGMGDYYVKTLTITKNVTITGFAQHLVHIRQRLRLNENPKPLVTIKPGKTVRLQRLTLHRGSPSITPQVSQIAGPSISGVVLELDDVSILQSGIAGAIRGRIHLRAYDLFITGSAGHGIRIVGSADLRVFFVSGCAGWGAVIYNSGTTPSESPAGPWVQQICYANFTGNAAGGLWIEHLTIGTLGTPFVVGCATITGNGLLGVVLKNADGTTLQGLVVDGHGWQEQNLYGAGVTVLGSSGVTVEASDIEYNGYGIHAIACQDLGDTSVIVDGNTFDQNYFGPNIAHSVDPACPGSSPAIVAAAGNVCVSGSCTVVDVPPLPLLPPPLGVPTSPA